MGDNADVYSALRTPHSALPPIPPIPPSLQTFLSPFFPSSLAPSPSPLLIVTGLPRSGTSMLMQMLEAAGIPILSDGHRPPDEFNPRGYYEYEPVKRLHRDNTWLRQHHGKAVKIVAPLLPCVPRDIDCRVVFIHRNMEAIMASQARMLGQIPDEAEARVIRAGLEKCLRRAEEWVREAGWPMVRVEYQEVVGR